MVRFNLDEDVSRYVAETDAIVVQTRSAVSLMWTAVWSQHGAHTIEFRDSFVALREAVDEHEHIFPGLDKTVKRS